MDSFKVWLEQERADILDHNQTRLAACCGKRGRGKSYSSIAYGRSLLGDGFDVKRHIAYFDTPDFLRILRTSHKGDFVIFDDAGVGQDSRDWQRKSNRMMTKIGQIFRTKNLYITFTTPDFSFVDIKWRKSFDYFISMRKIDFKKQQTVAKWYQLETDEFTGDFYRRNLRIDEPNGRSVELDYVRAGRIPDDVAKEYEELRQKASDKLFKEADEWAAGYGDKSVTIDQAAQLLNIEAKVLWNAAARGWLKIMRDATTVKVPFKWVRDVSAKLDLHPGDAVVIRDDGDFEATDVWDLSEFPLSDNKVLMVKRGLTPEPF